ncbi:FAD-binding FR-type domain-containing protein [Mycena indigotica]|uniref:FAD-binding FR-type domain-containing protein n=1 Tax=Mycena indigotica TaxID=2126181 RepID=A0A8H6SS06_9AGAR|nr:FAD-binding FR-type domain-containing protein [Mycena indigotica]KAF7303641.1 FAD-binding FR-type domain-containing protein [Mycena indigotica]
MPLTSPNRSSGLDFSDGNPPAALVPQDITSPPVRSFSSASRNKAERARLQGLQLPSTPPVNDRFRHDPTRKIKLTERISLWMINEGRQKVFFAVFLLLHLLVAIFGFVHYGLKDNLKNARATFGITYTIARATALVLHIDVIFILLPVCRNFITVLRRTPLGDVIPFHKNITLHKATGWAILIGSVVHVLAHLVNLFKLTMADTSATTTGARIAFFITANFVIGPLITGWLMLICLGVMVYFSTEKRRTRKNGGFERFWYTHHLFVPFFILWQFHGMFCMIKPDRPPFCSWNTIGVFWRYWIVGGLIWISERILREVRSRHVTYISKVIQHPSDVMELQIKKEKTTTRAGQYIFINCPEISYFQWHPFTLTSAPEEDYISVHIRVTGDFTRALAKSVGCDFEGAKTKAAAAVSEKGKEAEATVVAAAANPRLNRVLPRIMVDGPFGSSSEDFLNFETVLLVGAGIGVTPFASILKSIWYRMQNFSDAKKTRLSKVYFTWVIRDFGTAEWFHSLLRAIEEQDSQSKIEINIYLTGPIQVEDVNNIVVHDVGAEKDAITSLRAPTHYGRPNWEKVFKSLGDKHSQSDIGVFYCGPKALASTLRYQCNKNSDARGARFFFGKENF